MSLEPPPRIVDKFVNIWRDWLFFFWEFVDSHTGGSSPTPPATGTSWNAHGNTATGEADNPLVIDAGSFIVTGSTGDHPPQLDSTGSNFAWIPGKGTLVAGVQDVTGLTASEIGTGDIILGKNNSSVSVATSNVLIGEGNSADGAGFFGTSNNNTVIGLDNYAGSFGNTVVGASNSIDGGQAFALVVGNDLVVERTPFGLRQSSMCMGRYLKVVDGQNSGVIGIGRGSPDADQITNNIPYSLMLGCTPAPFGGNPDATHTIILRNNRLGVIFDNPLSTLDVGGSVGFQYTTLDPTVSGTTYPITGDEYTFRIDVSSLLNPNDFYNIQLPVISTSAVDRRIYYFKVTDIAESNGQHGKVRLIPGAAQYIEDFNSAVGHRLLNPLYMEIDAGTSITLIANNTDSTWWVI